MKKTMIGLLVMAALGAGALALANEESVNKRQENQEKRIEQGMKSGSLTKRETKRLKRQQKRIGKAEEKAMEDGKMTKRESRRINKMQKRASRNIGRKKHNRRR